MDTISFKVDGLDTLARRLKNLVGLPRLIIIPIVAKYALAIQSQAKRLVSVDQGITRASILTEYLGAGLTSQIGSEQKTAVWLEMGTAPHMPPPAALAPWCRRHGMEPGAEWAIARHIAIYGTKAEPFLEPAFMEQAPLFVDDVNAELGKGIEDNNRS